jgi:hypothetical protein
MAQDMPVSGKNSVGNPVTNVTKTQPVKNKFKMFNFIKSFIYNIKKEYKYRKKLKELRTRDPFIYK